MEGLRKDIDEGRLYSPFRADFLADPRDFIGELSKLIHLSGQHKSEMTVSVEAVGGCRHTIVLITSFS
jgi:hypothetical protein